MRSEATTVDKLVGATSSESLLVKEYDRKYLYKIDVTKNSKVLPKYGSVIVTSIIIACF